jgi:formyl-CoA transferase
VTEAPAPLAGLRVVELGQVLAGPFAGVILTDLGASVLKIEKPDGGDDARHMGSAFRRGDSLIFHEFNRGKRSVVLDLKTADGRAALDARLAEADIFLHNMRPGVVEAMGFGAEETTARHPRLIYCAISAFGHRGPHAGRPGYEPLMQAYCGLASITGAPGGPPVRMGASVVDQGTGMWAVIGILSALHQRGLTGRGSVVQASLFESAVLWAGQKIDAYVNEGREPERHASGHPGFVPYEAFDAADGPLLICCGNDRLFAKLARLLGREEWIEDPLFATNRARIANKADLLPMIANLLKRERREVWLKRLEAVGVPCAPINKITELVQDEHFQASGQFMRNPGEDFDLVGTPLSFNGERVPLRGPAPTFPGTPDPETSR